MTEITLYGHQIVPGRDNLLHFAPSLEACRASVIEQRTELAEHDPEYADLAPMAIYECVMRMPDQQTLVLVLNHQTDLFQACVIDRKLVEMMQ